MPVHESRLTFLLIVAIPSRFAIFDSFNTFNPLCFDTFDFRSIFSLKFSDLRFSRFGAGLAFIPHVAQRRCSTLGSPFAAT